MALIKVYKNLLRDLVILFTLGVSHMLSHLSHTNLEGRRTLAHIVDFQSLRSVTHQDHTIINLIIGGTKDESKCSLCICRGAFKQSLGLNLKLNDFSSN